MRAAFLILTILFFSSCNQDKKSYDSLETMEPEEKIDQRINKKEFKNVFAQDTTVVKKGRFNSLTISNHQESDSITALCTCQKDVKKNIMKIQLKTGIPNKSELDTLKKENRKGNKIMEIGGFDIQKKINGQFKFLTIILKDSIVKSINLYSKSTKKEYDGTDFASMNINKYHINISKMNYSIASDIYGNFLLHLPEEFGYFENDTILKGYFECYNWRISEKENIKNWNIQDWYIKKNASRALYD